MMLRNGEVKACHLFNSHYGATRIGIGLPCFTLS